MVVTFEKLRFINRLCTGYPAQNRWKKENGIVPPLGNDEVMYKNSTTSVLNSAVGALFIAFGVRLAS